MKKISGLLLLLCLIVTGTIIIPEPVRAADSYTISYRDLSGNELSSSTVVAGEALGTLPAETDLLAWVYDECRMATDATIPDSNMVITAIHTTDVTNSGTLDGGNITWFILNNKLYVTGSGTLAIANKALTGATKTYGASISQVNVKYPAIMYTWMKSTTIGDEQGDGYGTYSVPVSDEYSYNMALSNELAFTDQTISYPATALADAAPWLANASSLTAAYFSEDVKLSGNYTLYFNQNSETVIPSAMQKSVYTNLKEIYLLSDTSAITRMAGMFAYMPALEHVYVKDGESFDMSSCVDVSLLFYGDTKLISGSTLTRTASNPVFPGDVNTYVYKDMIDCCENTSALTDMRYAFFDCQSINKPNLHGWNTSNVTDMSYAFSGCVNAELVCDGSGAGHDLSSWNTGKVFSMSGMFSAPTIDLTAANPVTNTWGATTANVVKGTFDLSKWDLTCLRTAFYMFGQNHGITSLKISGSAPILSDIAAIASWCDGLVSVDFSNLSTPMLTDAACAFFEAGSAGSNGNFSSWDMTAITDARYMFYHSKFTVLNFNGTNPALLQKARGMFANCDSLTSVGTEGLSGWTIPVVEDTSYMFNGDSALTILTATNWGLNSDRTIAYMFSECKALTGLDTASWRISSLLGNMDCAFYKCAKIPTLKMSTWDVTGLTNAFFAFADMTALSDADTSGWNLRDLTVSNGMFKGCYSLPSIALGSTTGSALKDASGMFYGDVSLTSAAVQNLVKTAATNIAYFMSGCSGLETLDISGWDTTSAQFMQAAFDGMSSLETLTIGSRFSTASAVSTGAMYRGDSSLKNDSLQSILTAFNPANDEDLYEMFRECSLLESTDLKNKDFSKGTEYTRMFYADGKLTTITLPASFMSGITDSSGHAKNAFYCTETTPTKLVVDSVALPQILKGYDWDGDNRTFVKEKGAYINENAVKVYTFTPSSSATANMALDAESTFYLQDTALPLSYKWYYGGGEVSGETNPNLTATREDVGSYTITASLNDLTKASGLEETFSLSAQAGAASIEATYTGATIIIGNDYSKDDVNVIATYTDGTKKTISSGNFTVDSQKVTKTGNNNTYTASYTDEYGNIFTSNFTVPGKRVIGSIVSSYVGPSVAIGKEYDKNYVITTAYYADDTTKSEGFAVTPNTYSGTKITQAGTNTFTAYYTDTDNGGKVLSSNFNVPGYQSVNVGSITAEYTGPNIVVGNKYDKSKVKVTIHYTDGTPDATTTDFTVDDLLVKTVGSNQYVAAYTSPTGISYEANFTVTGIKSSSGSGSSSTPTTVTPTTAATLGSVGNVGTGAIGTTTAVPATTVAAAPAGTAPITVMAKTGDTTPIILVIVIFGVAVAGLVILILIKKGKIKIGNVRK